MPQNVAEMAAWRMFTFVLGMNLYATNNTAMYMHVVSMKMFTSWNSPLPSKNEDILIQIASNSMLTNGMSRTSSTWSG